MSVQNALFQMTAVANSAANTAGRNAVVTSLLVCCGFVVCWTPNVILYLLSLFGYNVDFGSWLYHFTLVLVFTNSCINPFYYHFATSPNFFLSPPLCLPYTHIAQSLYQPFHLRRQIPRVSAGRQTSDSAADKESAAAEHDSMK